MPTVGVMDHFAIPRINVERKVYAIRRSAAAPKSATIHVSSLTLLRAG